MNLLNDGVNSATGVAALYSASEPSSYNARVTGNGQTTIHAIAMGMVGISTVAKDRYTDWWATWINLSRDELIAELSINGHQLLSSEISFVTNGSNIYDLSPFDFLRIDNVAYGTDTNRTPLPLYTTDLRRWIESVDPTVEGTPYMACTDGMTALSITRALNDSAQSIYVSGPRLPSPMESGDDCTMLSRLFNECVAAGAAMRACQYDAFNLEVQAYMPGARDTWQRRVVQLGILMKRSVRGRTGLSVAPGRENSYARRIVGRM